MPAAALAWDGALRDPNQKTSQPVVSSRRMVSVRRIVDVSLTSSAMAELSSMTKVRSVQGVEQLGQLYAFTVDVIAVDRALDVPALSVGDDLIVLDRDGRLAVLRYERRE